MWVIGTAAREGRQGSTKWTCFHKQCQREEGRRGRQGVKGRPAELAPGCVRVHVSALGGRHKSSSPSVKRTAGILSFRGGQTVIPPSHNAPGVRVHGSGVARGGGGVRPTRQIARRGLASPSPPPTPIFWPCVCRSAPPAGGTSRQQLRPPPSQPQLFPSPDYRSANLLLGDSRPPLPHPPAAAPVSPCYVSPSPSPTCGPWVLRKGRESGL